ncbi:hypothetical protein E308F_09090 [Moorella sp. E308F]|uniref:hypothetical protein n=1 Tax=Moorella sp. E308F TaxID=2572682 RepID=UPI0010FFC49E|nr:hypothetical protein [Moorella sp. E308F]GEA14667.1 hypothetical protein E308F_09090 [Moorella sp. E308F]
MPTELWRGLFRTALAILAGRNIAADAWTLLQSRIGELQSEMPPKFNPTTIDIEP